MDATVPGIPQLLAFEACARHHSFSRAAEELSITPSAVSHRIRELEQNVGESLFVRNGRRIELTVAGTRYLHDVREALQHLGRLARPRLGDARRERLRVVSPPTFARQVLVPHLPGFVSAHEWVELELSLSVPFSEVRGIAGDLEIQFSDGRFPAGTHAERLMEEVLFPVASPAYARKLDGRLRPDPAAIARADLLRNPVDSWDDWFRAAGVAGGEPRSGPRFNDLGLLLEASAQGQGVALARSVIARGWLESGALVRLSPIETSSSHSYYVVATPAAMERKAALAFLEWLGSMLARAQRLQR